MDYKRIYDAFIKGRRIKEASLIGYVERHHILPKCMGGGDNSENLIRLTPEDHYFAHLLLAKAYGGKNWVAVHAMCHLSNEYTKSGRNKLAARMQFGYVRRALAAHYRDILSGPHGKRADKTEYTMKHFDGRVACGNRFDLASVTGVSRQQISALLRGAKKTAHGWYSPAHNPNGLSGKELASATIRSRAYATLFHFDGRVWSGSPAAFSDMTGAKLTWNKPHQKHIAGWHRTREDAAEYAARVVAKSRRVASARGCIAGARNPNADALRYQWRVVATGELVDATKYEIRTRFLLKAAQISALFAGRQSQTGGIALAEETESIARAKEAYRKSRRAEYRLGGKIPAYSGGEVCRAAIKNGRVHEGRLSPYLR
jgi:hypothetical protein